MPDKITSKAQWRLMEAIRRGAKMRKGPSREVAAEMLATQRKPYKKLPAKKRARKSS